MLYFALTSLLSLILLCKYGAPDYAIAIVAVASLVFATLADAAQRR